MPNACVEYLVVDWITAYWLHVDVFGNPRAQPRTDTLVNDFRGYQNAMTQWPSSSNLPYAVSADLRRASAETLANADVIFQVGDAALLRRRGDAACAARTMPFDQVVVAPRGWTVAQGLAAIFK